MRKRTDQEIDQIIDILTDINRAEVSPYFKTRLLGKLQQDQSQEDSNSLPYYILITATFVLMMINTFFLNNNFNQNNQENNSTSTEISEDIYQLNTTTYNYDYKK